MNFQREIKKLLNRHEKLNYVPYSILILMSFLFLLYSILSNNYHFVYSLDDPYIHMSIAKNLIKHGMWSVNEFHVSSASSSPLWTMLLSMFYLLTTENIFIYIPCLLNILFQIFSICLVIKIVKEKTGENPHFILLTAIIFFTPFIALSSGGMEHSLQIFILLLFIKNLINYLDNLNTRVSQKILLLIAPFLVLVRYEDLAIIVSTAIILTIFYKDWKLSLSLVFSSLLFVVIFGIINKFYLGLGFLPTSIMAKSFIFGDQTIMMIIETLMLKLYDGILHPHIAILLLINSYILYKTYRNNRTISSVTFIFILALLTHVIFAKLGWLYRYEAYLIVFGMLNLAIYMHTLNDKHFKYMLTTVPFVAIAFYSQILLAPYISLLYSNYIYKQQYQMAQFLKEYYNDKNIAANDIGAITYYTDIKLLDLYGSGSYKVLEYRKNNAYTSDIKNKLLSDDNVSLVVVYKYLFKNTDFKNYTKMGEWTIKNNVYPNMKTVTFYSIKNNFKENLENFKKFSKNKLPNSIAVKINNSEF